MNWKEWLIKDYVRYWYVILCMAILILGVGGAFTSQASPATPLTLFLWGLVLISVVALEVVGYILLWKRESPAGKRLVALFSSFLRQED